MYICTSIGTECLLPIAVTKFLHTSMVNGTIPFNLAGVIEPIWEFLIIFHLNGQCEHTQHFSVKNKRVLKLICYLLIYFLMGHVLPQFDAGWEFSHTALSGNETNPSLTFSKDILKEQWSSAGGTSRANHTSPHNT